MSSCKIELDNHVNGYHRKYRPRDTVEGKVLCTFPVPIIVEDVKVELVGEERTEWSNSNTGSSEDGDDNTYKGYHQFLSMSKSAPEGTIETTTYAFDFSFALPENIPGSFKCERGWVKFFIRASVGDNLAIEDIDVESPIRNTDYPSFDTLNKPYDQSVKQSIPSASGDSAITMDAYLTKRSFVQSEPIPIMLDIKNNSDEKIDKIRVVLGQTIQSKAETPDNDSRFDNKTIALVTKGGVKSNDNKLVEIVCRIPETTLVPNFSLCKLFKQQCWIDVTAVIRDDLNVNLCIWIQIGQISSNVGSNTSTLPLRSDPRPRSVSNTRPLLSSNAPLQQPTPRPASLTPPRPSRNLDLRRRSETQQTWDEIHGITNAQPSAPVPDPTPSTDVHRQRLLSLEEQVWNEVRAIVTQVTPPPNTRRVVTPTVVPPNRSSDYENQIWNEVHAIVTQTLPSHDNRINSEVDFTRSAYSWIGSVAPPDASFVARPSLSLTNELSPVDDVLSCLRLDASPISPPPCYEDVVWGHANALPDVAEESPPSYTDVIWDEIRSSVNGAPRPSECEDWRQVVSVVAPARGVAVGSGSYTPPAPPLVCDSMGGSASTVLTNMSRPLFRFSRLERSGTDSIVDCFVPGCTEDLTAHPSDSLPLAVSGVIGFSVMDNEVTVDRVSEMSAEVPSETSA